MLHALLALFLPQSKQVYPARERFLLPTEWLRVRPVLDRKPPKVRVFFYVLLLQAPRRSEASHMEWTHLDLTEGLWHKPMTKSGKPQLIALSPQVCAMLKQLPRRGRYVFPGCSPDRPWGKTAIGFQWKKIRLEADVPDVRIHDLRRTCASWLTMHGENLKIAQSVLGHASLATTQIYARCDQTAVRAALTRHADRLLA